MEYMIASAINDAGGEILINRLCEAMPYISKKTLCKKIKAMIEDGTLTVIGEVDDDRVVAITEQLKRY